MQETDKDSCRKEEEQEKLAKILNSMLIENQRTVDNLPSLWKNTKRKAKVDVCSRQNIRRRIGGGPAAYEMNSMKAKIAGMHSETCTDDHWHTHVSPHFLYRIFHLNTMADDYFVELVPCKYTKMYFTAEFCLYNITGSLLYLTIRYHDVWFTSPAMPKNVFLELYARPAC